MDPDQQLRNLRDFLLVYNRMTEICFQRCTSNFNYRNLTMDEDRCVDSCAGKLIRSNHRLMGTYVQLMPRMVQRRMEEMESKAAEMAASASLGSPDTSAASVPPQTPELLGADVQPGSRGTAGPDAATERDSVKLSAATPVSEPRSSPAAYTTSDGQLYTSGFPEASTSAAQIEPGR